jgi:hypothetical protein
VACVLRFGLVVLLCTVTLLDCSGASPSVDHLFPVRSPARVVSPVFRQAKGSEARTNVCDLHASNSLVLAGHGNVQGTLGTIPFCKTHGMACVRVLCGGAIFGQAKQHLYCMPINVKSHDQSINQWPCCHVVLCKDGSVTTVGTVRCSPVQPMSMAYYSSTTGQH